MTTAEVSMTTGFGRRESGDGARRMLGSACLRLAPVALRATLSIGIAALLILVLLPLAVAAQAASH